MPLDLSEALGAPSKVAIGKQIVDIYPLDFNDMVEIEEKSGKSLDDLSMDEFLKPVKNQRWFLWLALRKSNPDLTEQEVGRLFRLGSAKDQAALLEAIFSLSGFDAEAADPNSQADAEKPSASAA